jgi:hypothetical protein
VQGLQRYGDAKLSGTVWLAKGGVVSLGQPKVTQPHLPLACVDLCVLIYIRFRVPACTCQTLCRLVCASFVRLARTVYLHRI